MATKTKDKFFRFFGCFYVLDFNKPPTEQRQPFLYNHNRHREFNLNLGFIKANIEHSKYRGNFAIQAGTYTMDNYAPEPSLLKNVFEANVGISISKNKQLWVDTGIFPSHIGFESAISSDNWTLTRSILAENSPYYLSGLKLNYKPTENLEINGLIVNGWQRIRRLDGNTMPSFGTQTSFTPSDKITFNWSTFLGTDDPDSTRRMRYFNNFFSKLQLTDRLGLILGFDIGFQQKLKKATILKNGLVQLS